ncbi:MAG: DNA repair protein RecN [Candidatus Marinimicrobia bacterium]|nr:DNA repair protein RecN [Candidatus Neomarinimicrobiota bacterium]
MGLKSLKITSFAIIDQLSVDFYKGFSVITGETGAGKSIIIDALNLALGEKANPAMIRAGASSAIIECTFADLDNKHPVIQFLQQNDLQALNGELKLRRELNINGRSKAWINQAQCPINILKAAGDLLVDLHGQHDHQSLLRDENHIEFLDAYGNYGDLRENVHAAYFALSRLVEKYTLLTEKRKLNREKRELWEFQLNEINKVDPVDGEYERLLKEKAILDNSEKIHTLSEELTNSLYEADENTLYQQVLDIIKKLDTLNTIDSEFTDELNRFEEMQFTIQDLSKHLTNYIRNIQFDPGQAENISQRLYLLQQLMKKYGSTIRDIVDYKTKIVTYLDEDDGLDNEIMKIEKEIEISKKRYFDQALKLSEKRKETATKFETELIQTLSKLGIAGSRFKVGIEQVESSGGWVMINGKQLRCDESGIDRVAFMISTNPGEPLRPLIDIVSGGEVSRIMLAMKSIMAGKDQIPVVIFDESDTGISGKVAQTVGWQLKKLSEMHQVICITHLPQIAGLGNYHYKVYKQSGSGRSQTNIDQLDHEERVTEIASLIGGTKITDTTLKQARELLTD